MSHIPKVKIKSELTPEEMLQWRQGLMFEQTDAARALGVCRRTYQDYELNGAPRRILLATFGHSVIDYITSHPDAPDDVLMSCIRRAAAELIEPK